MRSLVCIASMRVVILALTILAFAVLEIFLGGARVLYTIPGVCLLGLAGLLSLATRKSKSTVRAEPFALGTAILFTGYILIRNRLSEVDYIGRLQFFIMAGSLIVYLIFILVLNCPEDRRNFVYSLMLLGLVQVGIGAVQFANCNQWMPLPWGQRCDTSWRATGFFISPNNYAGYLEIIALMGMSLFVWSRVGLIVRTIIAYATLCCIAGVALSGSRGGYVSLAVGSFVLLVLTLIALRRLRPKKFTAIAPLCVIGGAILLAAVLCVMFQSQILRSRVMEINDPSNMRLLLWSSALEQFRLAPVFGTGGFSFLYYARLFRNPVVQNDPIHVHNDYVQLLADYGVVGAILFAAFLCAHLVAGSRLFGQLVRRVASYKESRSNHLALCIGCLSVVAAYMVHSVVDFNMQMPANALLIAVVFAILANTSASGGEQARTPRLITLSGWLLPAMGIGVLAYGLPMMPGEYFTERARFALVRLQKPAEALEFARQGLKTESKNPDLYYYYGEAALQMASSNAGNPLALRHGAVISLKKGLEAFPYDSRLAVKLAQAYSESGNYFEASNALTFIEKWDPSSSFVHLYRGLIEQAGGSDDAAESAYKEAISLGGEGGDFAREGLLLLYKMRANKSSSAPPPSATP